MSEVTPRAPAELDALAELDAVATLADHGDERLDADLVERARELRQLAAERLSRSAEHVVIAVAGGTGTGKSSLVNALVYRDLATVGVRRPTTAAPLAVVVGADAERATTLLDWLGVTERHQHDDERLAGAVLLDLPDIDSVEQSHWAAANRLIDRTDLLLWVLDPTKYAHALTHQRYFARLARHAEVLLVALNHADRLTAEQQAVCVADLRDLLAAAGLGEARVFTTSAVTGAGLDELTDALAEEVQRRSAPAQRLRADAAVILDDAAACLPRPERVVLDHDGLVDGLCHAVAAPRLAQGARGQYLRRAALACRSPARRAIAWLTRLVQGLVRTAGDVAGVRSTPQAAATPVSATAVTQALLDAVAPLTEELPAAAANRLADRARARAEATVTTLRRSVEAVPLRPDPRAWWVGVSALRGLAQLVALAGLAWLVLAGVAVWLGLPPLPQPDAVGDVPWPTALLLGGILASLLVGGLARLVARLAAARHQRRTARHLHDSIRAGAETALQPLHDEVAACKRLARAAHDSSTR